MSRNIVQKKSLLISKEEQINNSTKQGKLVLTFIDNRLHAFLLVNDKLKAVCIPSASKIGQIHLAKVKNTVSRLNACFVELADKEIAFLPYKDASYAMIRNRMFDGRIKEGDEFPVLVSKDAQKKKPASVTTNISLSNSYFVFGVGEGKVRFSSKLSAEDKTALTSLLVSNNIMLADCLLNPEFLPQIMRESKYSFDLVIRTKAADLYKTDSAICLEAFHDIIAEYQTLLTNAAHNSCFSVLFTPPDSLLSQIEEYIKPYEYKEIVTDSQEIYDMLVSSVDKNIALRLYNDPLLSLQALYNLNDKLRIALEARIWLKSGAYLYIEPTEALTVIDVNSGKYEAARGDEESYALKVNMEAAEEIAHQLRLRNFSGIIVVDFINMRSPENKKKLLDTMSAYVAQDIISTKVIDMTPLGLVEITRKKNAKPLREQINMGNKNEINRF